jgi:hypothetical protein|tara:strand:- start:332 stop:739 length:408 start_codon:yes stop_codon:yes gene_type:complete
MLVDCPYCNAKYLVNSADLQPEGRIVECAKCSYQWFQNLDIAEKNQTNFVKKESSEKISNSVKTLPSTYVHSEKISYFNSILMVIFVFGIIGLYFVIKDLDKGLINFLNYYIQEFIFNLKYSIDNLAKTIHQIIN